MNTNKKVYTKPEISFVNFELSSSIANTCVDNTTTNQLTGEVLPQNDMRASGGDNGWDVFGNDTDCSCYHVPTVDTKVFNS